MRILIAEDDRMSRTFLEEFMRDYGECDSAADGMETLDRCLESIRQERPYDLLCLDIMMPKVDGLKVLKVIRGLEEQYSVPPEKHMKVIVMTALDDIGHINQAFRLGCDAYASKPIDTEKVREVMKNLGLILSEEE
ncbi:response regulator [Selenomonas montiformis]|uniref:response regulator n=1 Tax=Selenomonas montiformis TaxID=2652285 RepID=UPI003F8BB3F7